MKKQFFALCLFIFVFLFPQTVLAARSISITSDKSSLFGDGEMNISASLSGFTNNETIYLKGAFSKVGSTNYFGYTKKGDVWIKNSTTALEQRQVKIGEWDEALIVKSDFSDTGYSGKRDYSFKVGFYYITSGGNISSVNWSENYLTVSLDQPTPTPTAISISAQTTTFPIKSAQSTKTPPPSKIVSFVPSKNPVLISQATKGNNSVKIVHDFKSSSQYAQIKSSIPSKKPSSNETKVLGAKNNNLPALMITGGLLLFVGGIGWFGLKILKEKGLYEKLFNK